MAVLQKTGKISLLRAHELNTGYGPEGDQIDGEIIFKFAGSTSRSYGFELRDNNKLPAQRAMLDLLRDGFNHNWDVTCDYRVEEGKSNAQAFRIWLTKPSTGLSGIRNFFGIMK